MVRTRAVQQYAPPAQRQQPALHLQPIDMVAYYLEDLKYGNMMIVGKELAELRGQLNDLESPEDFSKLLYLWAVSRRDKFLSQWRAENGHSEPVEGDPSLQPR